ISPLARREIAQAHGVTDALHLLLVAPAVVHGALFSVLQCCLQRPNPLSPSACSVSGTFSPREKNITIRRSSSSSLWMVSLKLLFFSFSFSYLLFHCSAVSSRLMEAVFLMVLAL
uniref:Uncharacterized protein n=1 Tax=Sinocyclocheilus anshuiensis TaxID=1608454 RepID=A0A671MTN9_9TELE